MTNRIDVDALSRIVLPNSQRNLLKDVERYRAQLQQIKSDTLKRINPNHSKHIQKQLQSGRSEDEVWSVASSDYRDALERLKGVEEKLQAALNSSTPSSTPAA